MRRFLPILLVLSAGIVFGADEAPDTRSAKVLQPAEAEFPAALKARGIVSGRAAVTVAVDAEGRVTDAIVTAYTGPEFGAAAEAAARQWTFVPAMAHGQPAAALMDLQFSFGTEPPPGQPGREPWAYQLRALKELDEIPAPKRVAAPAYPADLQAAGGSGEARVTFFIDRQGRIRLATVTGGTGRPFELSALNAVRDWSFAPPQYHGQPADVRSEQSFHFSGDVAGAASRPLLPPRRVARYALPGPRYGSGAAASTDAIYIVGGHAGGSRHLLPEIVRFDLRTHECVILTKELIERVFPGVALIDGKLYILGGRNRFGAVWQNVQIYDLATGRLSPGPAMPTPRANFALAVVGRRIYVAGGLEQPYDPTDEMAYLDVDKGAWTSCSPMLHSKVVQGAVMGGKFLLPGGYRVNPNHDRTDLRTIQEYDFGTDRWTALPPLPVAMDASSVQAMGRRLYIFGDFENPDQVEIYDVPTGRAAVYRYPQDVNRNATSVVVGDRIYVIGGQAAGAGVGLASAKIDLYQVSP